MKWDGAADQLHAKHYTSPNQQCAKREKQVKEGKRPPWDYLSWKCVGLEVLLLTTSPIYMLSLC